MIIFTMTYEVAEEFYARCKKRKAETEEERTAILVEMAREGLLMGVSQTERTREEYVEDLSKEFNVLDVKPNGEVWYDS